MLFFAHFAIGAMPEWLFDLLFPLFFISQIISGVGYTQRFVDLLTNEKTIFDICKETWQKLKNFNYKKFFKNLYNTKLFEVSGIGVGILLGLIVTIIEVIMHVPLPGAAIFRGFSILLQLVLSISTFAGLLNRMGRMTDYFRNAANSDDNIKNRHLLERLWNALFLGEDVNYTLSIIGGVIGGIVLTTVALTIVGTSVASMGASVPIVFAIIIFCISIIGSSASASGYIGRCFDAVLGKQTIINAILNKKIDFKLNFEKDFYQKTLTLAGTVVGLVIGITLVACGITTLPFFGSGLPPLLGGITLILFTVGGVAGFANRFGNMLDKAKKKKQPTTLNIQNENTDTFSPSPMPPSLPPPTETVTETVDVDVEPTIPLTTNTSVCKEPDIQPTAPMTAASISNNPHSMFSMNQPIKIEVSTKEDIFLITPLSLSPVIN